MDDSRRISSFTYPVSEADSIQSNTAADGGDRTHGLLGIDSIQVDAQQAEISVANLLIMQSSFDCM